MATVLKLTQQGVGHPHPKAWQNISWPRYETKT